ncbi:MAG: helix-turn-helix transcriptional regulator [Rhodobacteraceae bacterium]|nr:helix-turn-helix transcriptional regulator [Paracoccaceae bacterium]
MKRYGSFCPIAKASEILSERWTFLIVRELMLGAFHFNDIRRGVPRMSPALLAKRLRTLQDCEIVSTTPISGGRGFEYRLTQAGEDLRPIIELAGHWGQRWARSKLPPGELDPGELMWYIRRHFGKIGLPARRIVMQIDFTDVRRMKRWWVLLEDGEADLCLDDPGFDIDIYLTTDLLSLTQVYIGDLSFARAVSKGCIELDGPRDLLRGMPVWFARSRFADDNPIWVD